MIKRILVAVREVIFNSCVSLRSKIKNKKGKIIVGFVGGAKGGMPGSSKPLFDAILEDERFFVYWVYPELSGKKSFGIENYKAYYRRSFYRIGLYVKTDVWITTHGDFGIPFNYTKYQKKRIELWHGIPFKGFLKENRKRIVEDFNKASTVVVTSDFFMKKFSEKWGVDKKRLKDLGQPRTDALLNGTLSKDKIKKRLGIYQKKVILYAPTHEQDSRDEKTLFPWDETKTLNAILSNMDKDTALIIRPHPNWKEKISNFTNEKINKDKRLFYIPYEKFNIVEEIIYISDVLITDWSSIYFDFLLLKKPVIFLDLPNPFENNFFMKPSERIGYISSNTEELSKHMYDSLNNLQEYSNSFNSKIEELTKKVYSKMDGESTKRCIHEIIKLVNLKDH